MSKSHQGSDGGTVSQREIQVAIKSPKQRELMTERMAKRMLTRSSLCKKEPRQNTELAGKSAMNKRRPETLNQGAGGDWNSCC